MTETFLYWLDACLLEMQARDAWMAYVEGLA